MIGLFVFLAEVLLNTGAGGGSTAPSVSPLALDTTPIGASFGGDFSTPPNWNQTLTQGTVQQAMDKGAVNVAPIAGKQVELLNQIIGNPPNTPQPNVYQTPSLSVRNLIATQQKNPYFGVISNRLG
jgi:hypothetical protein